MKSLIILSVVWSLSQALNCPENFVELAASPSACYYFALDGATWIQAIERCYDKGATLVSIETSDESNAINAYINNNYGDSSFWTSGTDLVNENHFVWITTGKSATYTNWCPGEPTNGVEDCVHIHKGDGRICWNDISCSRSTSYIGIERPLHYICEYHPVPT